MYMYHEIPVQVKYNKTNNSVWLAYSVLGFLYITQG